MRRWLWALALILSGLTVRAQEAPLILVVEGVNPFQLFNPLPGSPIGTAAALERGYLARSPLAQRLAACGELRRLAWSGDPLDRAGIAAAVAALAGLLTEARGQGRRVWLLTHSLGAVIAYLALVEAGGGAELLVTLSTPLGRPGWLDLLRRLHPQLPWPPGAVWPDAQTLRLKGWLNVYVPWDPLGGPVALAGVENQALSLAQLGPQAGMHDLIRAHTLPYRDAVATQRVLDWLGRWPDGMQCAPL
ncbi:MAG: hypothetical protein NZ524_10345 [Thiobacillaceae bacterium]|nr:hypothetical protein [Thiobacillaceae bacterium]